ncbi:hypothetical protein B0H65DRAFT_208924 [Neurospora tetraspora]|uniref:Uncharacterized protein n=1 Tax=Neurospora tetraspora TaxID=94610 RepID=A0AAE0JFU5_9PEZI|nr:hypothetical protein B0H65DRAFT_208924 [Neurospora tetraspora]
MKAALAESLYVAASPQCHILAVVVVSWLSLSSLGCRLTVGKRRVRLHIGCLDRRLENKLLYLKMVAAAVVVSWCLAGRPRRFLSRSFLSINRPQIHTTPSFPSASHLTRPPSRLGFGSRRSGLHGL